MRRYRRLWMPVLAVLAMLAVLAAVYAIRDGDNELEQARAECESRDGQTELLHTSSPLYICYEITVDDDGWRICNASEPRLQVLVEEPYPPEYPYPCGNTPEPPEVVEAALAECETREGRTELLPYHSGYFACYEVTVMDNGWRTCAYSLPPLEVRAVAPYNPEHYPCGELGPEWPFAIGAAPSDCEAARDWYADYYRSVIDEMERIVDPAETLNGAAVQLRLSDLGHIFEQNGRRAEAAQASCATGESLGIYLAISEAQNGLDETYKSIVVSCLADGIHDCTALTPTPKAECERNSEHVYVLEQATLDYWPAGSGSGCYLRG